MTKEKESGLTKLIELLNEYEKEKNPKTEYKWFSSYYKPLCYGFKVPFQGWHDNGEDYSEEIATSKQYGFIKWLVENEKIEENSDLITLASELGCAFSSDVLLMYLAIQDNPIEFLVSILK